MSRPRLIQLIAVLCCGVLLFGASRWMPSINEGRRDLNIWGAQSPVENTPPEYAFAIQALGAFRGLVTDIAFIRAEMFKEQGRYYDAMQLAEWICTLQPHFPSVWEFAAWNMSWNISVTTFTPQERWNWVYNGVKLLRDRGIQFNPGAMNLYKQLAWTFVNKMSENTDEFHYAYKCNWAWRMHLLLGPPPNPLDTIDPGEIAQQSDPESQTEWLESAARTTFEQNEQRRRRLAEERGMEFVERDPDAEREGVDEYTFWSYEIRQAASAEEMQEIVDGPDSLDELFAQYPAAREMVAALRPLGIQIDSDELAEEVYWSDKGLAFQFFWPYRELKEGLTMMAEVVAEDAVSDELRRRMDEIDKILGVTDGNEAGEALVRFLQKKVLGDVYKLDPEHMLKCIEEFGPLDWRSVDAQALYWVTIGLIRGGETVHEFKNDKTNTARMLFFALRNSYLRNRIVFEPYPEQIHLSYLSLGRDLDFIEPMNQAYIRYGPLFAPGDIAGQSDIFRSGHINFLNESIRLLYLAGREEDAAHYYRYLQETYPTTRAGKPNPAFQMRLHDYVMESFRENLDFPAQREVLIIIEGLLINAYTELAKGDGARYITLVKRAREFHSDYMEDKQDPLSKRMALPSFPNLQRDVFRGWFDRPAFSHLVTLQKTRLWRRSPLWLRQSTFDDLLPRFEAECEAWGFDIDRAFPEPTGMAEYRKANPTRADSPDENNVQNLPVPSGG